LIAVTLRCIHRWHCGSRVNRTKAESETKFLDFDGETDDDLLEIMTWRETDPEAARAAWATFYKRHLPFLLTACRKYAQGLLRDGAGEDLAADTMLRVWDRGAATYRRCETTDPETARLRVRAWLSRIAHNIAVNRLRCRTLQEIDLTDFEWSRITEPAERVPSEVSDRLRAAMETALTDRERQVLRVVAMYADPRQPGRHLPEDALSDLERGLGTTRENIRQIKTRALSKLKAAVGDEAVGPEK